MFWAPKGSYIGIAPNSAGSHRVWLEVRLTDSPLSNVINVSVDVDDLERAISEWKASRVTSHA